jgi:glycosyltransferase involved in cell wall biosynthesis
MLHLGRDESGVRRYAGVITEGLRARPDVTVQVVEAGMLDGPSGSLRQHARALSGNDVVHLQWNRRGWGSGPRSVLRVRAFRRACQPPLVATLHDVIPRVGLRRRWLSPDIYALRRLGASAERIVVHSREEVRQLAGYVPPERVHVVPHFVENLELPLTPQEARERLGLQGHRVLTLLGFIFGRKGHKIMVDAIPALPPDVVVVYAGGPVAGRPDALEYVQERAALHGLGDRLRITGWLPDAELATWIAATHLAVVPFKVLSASGSLSTWIASGKPILASDLPGFREYNDLQPGALELFGPVEPEALGRALNERLSRELPEVDPKVAALARHLTVEKTIERYLEAYRKAIATRG